MQSFLWILDLLLLAAFPFSTAYPTFEPRQDAIRRSSYYVPPQWVKYHPDTLDRKVSSRCSADQIAAEKQGWNEAKRLSFALNSWKPRGAFQNVMDIYMGTRSTDTGGIFWGTNYQERVLSAITLNHHLRTGYQPWGTKVWVYCDEEESPFKDENPCYGNVGAYTWSDPGWFRTNHMLVLCPLTYFRAPSLTEQLDTVSQNHHMVKDICSLYWNKASIYFHESFHWIYDRGHPNDVLDWDPDDTNNIIYGPQKVKDIAATKNTPANSVIADAYTMAATAILIMDYFGSHSPPQPLSNPCPVVKPIAFDRPPSGWKSPQNPNNPFAKPDMSKWIDPK